jgi:hypothetical protein
MDRFYLGIHRSNWLPMVTTPVFISRRVFPKGPFPRAAGRYAIDSGGFTELQLHGEWTITAAEYVAFLRRAWAECGPFDFAAGMDWMCEPVVISGGRVGPMVFVGTHLSVEEHLQRTVANAVELDILAPDLPIVKTVQGFRLPEYMRCLDLYEAAGIDITTGRWAIGSVCRRQHMDEAADIIDAIRARGVPNLHGFGFKIQGLRQCWDSLTSADSMSWSKAGFYAGPCQHPPYATGRQPQSEANCLPYALAWRERHIHPPTREHFRQLDLFAGVAA